MGEVELAYTTTGEPGRPPVLLVAGLGAQLTSWEDRFCDQLADRGLFVIRFDNRDVGLSTHLGGGTSSDASEAGPPAYTLSELAADAAGLIEGLGLGSVHVVGASMGGMVAQILAIEHPDRVGSLTSIMSTTGAAEVGETSEAAVALLMTPPGRGRAAVVDGAVVVNRVLGSPAYPVAEDQIRERAAMAYDRSSDPAGFARQLQACLTAPDRTEMLQRVELPTLVVHGAADPLIGVSGGRATAAAIPGAELFVIDGMGHELPEPVWSAVIDQVAALIKRAEGGDTAADDE